MEKLRTKKIYVIDLFCGAGGTSTGIKMAHGNVEVLCCVNHDHNAIASHNANHPDVIHEVEDIRVLAMMKLKKIVSAAKLKNPDCEIHIWASLECTNHSRAKGGLPRDQDSRTLADHLFRYIEALNPDKIWIENVTEFMIWGPLDDEGKPIIEHKGKDFKKWINSVKKHGYNYDHRVLNAADFGAYTSRKRYFAQFSKWNSLGGRGAVWPETTHGDKGAPHKPVKDVLDFDDEGQSIFTRKKPLVEATLARIYAGLEKFVKPALDKKTNSEDSPAFIQNYYTSGGGVSDIDRPAPTITTTPKSSVVTTFLAKYYGAGKNVQSIDVPCGTVTTKDRFSFIQVQQGKSKSVSVDAPCGTITTNPKQNLVIGNFLMDTSFKNGPRDINEPCPTILACRKHHYLVNPQYSSKGSSVDKPCFTLIARMDKAPPYLLTVKHGSVEAERELTGENMGKIIDFMFKYGVADIRMRMLGIPELLKIQGFPAGYKLVGTKTEQKKFIGNSVECTQAKSLFDADYKSYAIKAKELVKDLIDEINQQPLQLSLFGKADLSWR